MELSDELLHAALHQVMLSELDELPSQEELAERYPVSRRFDRKIIRIIREEERSPFTRKLIRCSKRAAMFFLALLVTAFTAVMSVQAAREWLIWIFTGMFNTHTEIAIDRTESARDQPFLGYLPEVMPEGYIQDSYTINETHKLSILIYKREDSSGEIQIKQFGGGRLKVDTEGARREVVQVWGERAIYAEKNDLQMLLWTDSLYQFYIVAIDKELTKSDLIEIAEHMRIQMQEE
ncbi:DUF4367 domain-containing protein [Clostridium sp. D33t1_170424_F3]|uniref:DUF4367 domain-containing protein n=1 Tax=Clostridium sp. D33t1_170424_F3 TaxID=2787099 RepID=UPI0018AB8F45|nr:DUF4367 domain-containing protein [Clostridium sp. D33t1_170424_F3]